MVEKGYNVVIPFFIEFRDDNLVYCQELSYLNNNFVEIEMSEYIFSKITLAIAI